MQIPDVAPDTLLSWGAMIRPTNPAEFWEMAGAVLTLAVLVVTGIGLYSIRVAKKDIRLRAERETKSRAIDRCREMREVLFPMHGVWLARLRIANIELFIKDATHVTFDETGSKAKLQDATAWVNALQPDLKNEATALMNTLECWAMCFTHGLADAKVAETPCATAYCQMVVSLYPCILYHRHLSPTSGPYRNLVNLFESWYAPKTQATLLAQLERAKKLAKLPDPIGTK